MDNHESTGTGGQKRLLQIRNVIQQAAWCSGCLPDTLEAILDQSTVRELKRGETLSRVGEHIDQLTLVVHGVLEVSYTAGSGRRHIAGYVTTGDLYNLVPLMDNVPATHDTVAVCDSSTLQLSKSLVTTLIGRDAAFNSAVIVLLSQRSRRVYLSLADSHLLPLRQRLARILLHLVNQFGVPRDDGIHLGMKMAQDQLADYVGCSRPVLNRELKLLEQDRIILIRYSQIIVVDEPLLTSIAMDG